MPAPGVTTVRSRPSGRSPGRRAAVYSLLMIPALAVSYVVAYFLGSALQGALGLAEDELLWNAGVLGLLAGLIVIVLLLSPQIVGISLGVKARRLGERRLGTAAAILNALIAAYVLLVTLVNGLAA